MPHFSNYSNRSTNFLTDDADDDDASIKVQNQSLYPNI